MLALKRYGVLVIAGLLLVQLVATPQSKDDYTAEELSKQRREYSVALFAKLLCSGVFVIGRDADEFIKNDLARGGQGRTCRVGTRSTSISTRRGVP